MTTRCEWAGTNPLYVAYHDEEWGVPSHNDQYLFEMLILEGAQAGLRMFADRIGPFQLFSCTLSKKI